MDDNCGWQTEIAASTESHAPCFAVMPPDSRLFSMVWMHQHNSISNCCIVSLVLAMGDGADDAAGALVLVRTSFCVTVFSAARLLRLLDEVLPVSWPLGLELE